ncbi:hypothetical protein N0V90_011999 [Kalmusia sp. IMI 367209]|nr:hypothetical protein N0V90_011999 [Kalmusia sp. IMI 367209]
MDIQKWLNETLLPRQPPSPPVQRREHRLRSPEPPGQAPEGGRRRKQSTSDSSLLDALPQRGKVVIPEQDDLAEEHADESARTDASHPTSLSRSSVSNQPYQRKPRRKTRPERYEPVSKHAKERGMHAHRPRRGESKNARRKSRRMKADKPGSGIVQSFHAKNVPRDRLTVTNASVPDLVFSEMKFLQKHKDQPETDPQPGSPKKKRKKDQAHAREQEISAYFTSVRPTLAEKDSKIQAKESHRKKLRGIDRSERERSPVVDNAISTVEPTDKISYLGFGGKGPGHESGSYVSWSESIRAPSVMPARPRIESVITNGQLDLVHGGQEAGNTDGGGMLHSRPTPPTMATHLTNGSGERFQVSSLPPTNERLSRSHSLPQHPSSPRRLNLVDRAASRRTLESAASPSSMPPFVPTHSDHQRGHFRTHHVPTIFKARNHPLSVQISDPAQIRDNTFERETEQPSMGEGDHQTSSSLGRILEECNTVFHERRKVEALQANNTQEQFLGVPYHRVLRTNSERYPTIREVPTVRFASAEETYRPRAPTLSGPSIYEQQQQRQDDLEHELLDDEVDTLQVSDTVQHEYFDGDLDIGERAWNEEAELTAYCTLLDPVEEDQAYTRQVDDGMDRAWVRSNIVARPGFWRPNRLY